MIEDKIGNAWCALALVHRYALELGLESDVDTNEAITSWPTRAMNDATNALLQQIHKHITEQPDDCDDVLIIKGRTVFKIAHVYSRLEVHPEEVAAMVESEGCSDKEELLKMFDLFCDGMDKLYGNKVATPMIPVLKIGYKHV